MSLIRLRTFRASDEDWELWRARANAKNMSMSAWIRQSLRDVATLQAALAKEET